ncbi:MAG TPA: phenylacetate-CoA oxygenase subunit PaaJ [Gammaproteobacteria bacterium]|jgi:ring-1,2-phenylacetyl-CoA epoxidase subunit PaaD|nr:phenylacetate-CoA oxygenase subunit PaaJ [Gammaproteobacteria bacterium]HIO19390.1 phenylacetate-CoA oxygenase subunit PaaJ [Gammaproteobacteria bacterium]
MVSTAGENTRLRVLEALDSVYDPEIQTVSIRDLGIVRAVDVCDEEGNIQVQVMITPTYSGCPAMRVIEQDIHEALGRAGIDQVAVEQVLYPPWTTDWITDRGRRHLLASGIAPPACRACEAGPMESGISCPRCGSDQTRVLSGFGATACKALWRCDSCLEPFDYFKPH